MSHLSRTQIAEHKAQLETRAALERIRLTLALHAVRQQLMPIGGAPRGGAFRRPLLAIVVGLAAKRVGPAKLRWLLRIASFAVAAYRVTAGLRRAGPRGG